MIDKLWKDYFGTGWNYGEEPSKREVFEAGFMAAVDQMEKKTIEKKTVPEIIREWNDKFEGENK